MDTCLFCDIQRGLVPAAGKPIYEDDLVYAIHSYPDPGEGPIYLGHVMLITRRHTPDFATLTPCEAKAIGLHISRISGALKACAGAEKVYAEFYAEVTPHLHVILTARYPDMRGVSALGRHQLARRSSRWPRRDCGAQPAVARLIGKPAVSRASIMP